MRRCFVVVPLCAVLMLFAGCGFTPAKNAFPSTSGGNSTPPPPVPPSAPPPGPTISGVAAKNFLSGATITAYPVDPTTGAEGNAIGTATTASDGSFTLTLTVTPTGPVRLKATGGSFVDDTNVSNTVPNTIELDTLLDSVTSNVSGVAITVLTDMVNSITNGLFTGAASSANLVKHSGASGFLGNLLNSHAQGKVIVKGLYKLNKDPENTPPSNDGSDPDGLKVTIISGSMYQCGINSASASGATAGDWIKALSLDFSDGVFDGMYKDAQGVQHQVMLKTSSGQVPLSSSAGTTDFLNCMNQFTQGTNTVINNPNNQVPQNTINQTTGDISSSLITSPSAPSTGLNSGGSGSVASMTINGKQYLFVAARDTGIVVIDITNPTNPTPPIKVWNTLTDTAFAGNNNVGVLVPILGFSTHSQLLAINYYDEHIAIFNAEKLATGTPGADDTVATDWAGQSDPSGYDTYGALLDVARHGVWLMVSNVGYNFLDLSTNPPTIIHKYDIGFNQDDYTENLGGDVAANYIWGVNYEGIQLIDLKSGVSYELDSNFINTNYPDTAPGYNYWDMDQGLTDTGYHVGFAMNECTNEVGLYDLTKLTLTPPAQGSSNPSGVFVPANGAFVPAKLYDVGGSDYDTQCVEVASVDSSSHLAIFTEEWDVEDLYVAKVDDPKNPANGTSWQGFSDWTYFRPDNSSIWGSGTTQFEYGAGDPHSIGTVVAVANSKTYGYILSEDNQHLLVVDMGAFLGLPRVGTTSNDAHTVKDDPATSGAWWVWNWPGSNSGKKRTDPRRNHHRR